MSRNSPAVWDDGEASTPETSEADRIRAVYRRYDTSERWRRKRDPNNPGFSQLQRERWRKIAGILDAQFRGATPRVVMSGAEQAVTGRRSQSYCRTLSFSGSI
jgi:hypothetical protein